MIRKYFFTWMSERPLPVYLSQNRVVLTEGHGGTLPNRFISRVCVMVRGQEVEVESRAGALPSPQSVDEAWRHLGSRRSAPRRPRSSAASKSWLSALPLPASFASLWFFVLPLQSLSYSEAGMLSRKSTKAAFSARPLGVPSSLRPSLITLCLPYPGQWQVLHRSYTRRVSRQQRRRQRPWTQFRCLAQLLCLSGSCLFRCLCSFLPGMRTRISLTWPAQAPRFVHAHSMWLTAPAWGAVLPFSLRMPFLIDFPIRR